MAKKRANGEGSIHRLLSGSWQIRFMDGYKSDGTRNMKTVTALTLTAARKLKAEYECKKAAGLLAAKDYSFLEWSDIWFENHKHNISATTQEGYTYTLRRLQEHFKDRKIADIKAYDIEQFPIEMGEENRSRSSIAQSRAMLFQIFDRATANDIIMKNPVAHIQKMHMEQPKKKEAFTADEARKLMKELPENKIGWSIRLMLGTGMRPQELLALEPRHITKDGSSIVIEQAVVMQKGTAVIGPTKTNDSTRTIPVPECFRYCARALRDTDKKFIWEAGKVDMPCNPSYFRKQFKEALEAVEGIRVLTPHCCRHTYVTILLGLGVDVKTIQSIVGHADVDMTLYYAHAREPVRQEAVQRFSDVFSNRGGGIFGNVLDFVKSS